MKKSAGRYALLLSLAVVMCVSVAVMTSGSQRFLRLKHSLALALIPYAAAADLNIFGVGSFKMFLNPWDIALTPIIMFRGQWEPGETLWIVKALKEGDTFVDAGANVGYYTVIASKIVGDEGRVYAFEPDPESFALLEANVRVNGLTNVIAEQKALSNEPGVLKLFLNPKNRGDHRIYQPKHGPDREFVEVEAVSLDDYFAGDDRPIDFIKIDTQGAEGVIFEGLTEIAKANEDIRIAIEWWPRGVQDMGYDAAKLLSLVSSLGFHFYELGWLGDPSALKKFSADEVGRRFSVENGKFTNMLLTRTDGPEVIRTMDPVP
jgi:FkbM family methyltransferase